MSHRREPPERVVPSRDVDDIELDALLFALHVRYGYEFRGYARASRRCRVRQAVTELGFANVSELQGRVLRDEALVLELVSRLAISVTAMFRDPEVYAVLRAGGRYYTADYDAVLFDPGLVENVVFAEHSLATDAVFSEVHLVICRNVLIYFDQPLQDRALGLFAEALCRGGFLCLGDHETLSYSPHRNVFTAVAPGHRVYQKR
jgi:chemotaxis methyl-accepting protein methylase